MISITWLMELTGVIAKASLHRATVTTYKVKHRWSIHDQGWNLDETKWRSKSTVVEESVDELWLEVKIHSNLRASWFQCACVYMCVHVRLCVCMCVINGYQMLLAKMSALGSYNFTIATYFNQSPHCLSITLKIHSYQISCSVLLVCPSFKKDAINGFMKT